MKYGCLLRAIAIPMVLVFVLFLVIQREAFERSSGGRAGCFTLRGK